MEKQILVSDARAPNPEFQEQLRATFLCREQGVIVPEFAPEYRSTSHQRTGLAVPNSRPGSSRRYHAEADFACSGPLQDNLLRPPTLVAAERTSAAAISRRPIRS